MACHINQKEAFSVKFRHHSFFDEVGNLFLCFNISLVDNFLVLVQRELHSVVTSLDLAYLDLFGILLFHNKSF